MKNYEVLTEDLVNEIEELGPDERSAWLFLSEHEKYEGRWYVEGLDPSFFFDFEDIIGGYRTVSPAKLDEFMTRAKELDYRVMFADPPETLLDAWAHLNDPPPFEINSSLPGTINGMLPYQVHGYNYLKGDNLKGGFTLWSTGTGKSVFEISMIKHHMEVQDDADLCLVIVKPNNKVDTQKKFAAIGDIESVILDGTPKKREEVYDTVELALDAGLKTVVITNYEKFREDEERMAKLVKGRRVLIFWDEMPTKLRNRSTKLYQSVVHVLYGGPSPKWDKKTPKWLRQYMLTATPIENSPVDVFNCVRILDPTIFPKIKEWEKQFVATKNYFTREPETFHNLDKMGLELEFMTHQVDKEDPDIAKMFPEPIKNVKYIDWDAKSRKVYDKLQDIAAKLKEEEEEEISILALISVLQMLCDAPEMVATSAANREKFEEYLAELEEGEEFSYGAAVGSQAATMLVEAMPDALINEGHPKIEMLREILLEEHPDEKALIFSTWSGYIFPLLGEILDSWGVTYEVYSGTDKQRQEAKDRFRNDPDIRVLLLSDAGSDSIDLPEASVVIHYNSAWKWATETQRENRANRVNSLHKFVNYYVLVMANSVEDRKRELIGQKHGYHKAVFQGAINEEAQSARMTAEDLNYILTGG